MLVADTNVWIAMFARQDGDDIVVLKNAIQTSKVFMPPVVLSEILSDPAFPKDQVGFLRGIKLLEILSGYWERAGLMRAEMIRKGYKPKLPDTLIAQSCIDHDMPLLTRDDGFGIFAAHGELKLQNNY